MELRPYQTKFVKDIFNSLRNGNRVVATLGCGGGKSVCMAYIAKLGTDAGKRIITTVHRKELAEQLVNTYNHANINSDLSTVGMIQTLINRINLLEYPNLIICDEGHHYTSKSWKKLTEAFPDSKVIYFTATPIRLNEGGLGSIADDIVTSVSTKWLIENKYLAPYRYYSLPLADFNDLKVKRGEYDNEQLSMLFEDNKIYGDTVRNFKRIAADKKTLVYCSSVQAAKETAAKFRSEGFKAIALDGGTPKVERADAMNKFRSGEIQVLTNAQLFDEGLDIPDVECCILVNKTKSLTKYIQMSMRCMRIDSNNPSKTGIIIDHGKNVYEHDFPDADRVWELNPKKKKKGENECPVKDCLQCFTVITSQTRICPICGYEFPVSEPGEKKLVDVDLQDITGQQIDTSRYEDYKKCKDFNDLVLFQKQRKYKFGWVLRKADELGFNIPSKYNYMMKKMGMR